MSIEQIVQRKDLNLSVFVGRKYNYKADQLIKAQLEGYSSGIELKIEVTGTDFHEVMYDIWNRWCIATRSIPELAAPMIEHQPIKPPTSVDEDYIPF